MSPVPHRWIVAGACFGAACGLAAHAIADDARGISGDDTISLWLDGLLRWVMEPAGAVFRGLLLMLALPLTFSALVLGVAGFADLRALGRVGVKTLLLTLAGTSVAVLLGIGLVALVRPGASAQVPDPPSVASDAQAAPAPKSGLDFFLQMIPDNPLRSAAAGDYPAVMAFALLFGIALACTKSSGAARLKEAIEGVWDVCMTLLRIVLRLAPIGVFALLYSVTAKLGWGVVAQLGAYVAVVVAGLAIQLFVVQGTLVRVLGGMGPVAFFRAVSEAMLTAFSTSSSNATLSTALAVADEKLRLPRAVSRFVLTIGATANQHGTALFEGVTVLFLAQLYRVELSMTQQLLVVGISVLGGIGTAGIPSGSIPVIAMILTLVGIPAEGIAIILGVDRFLDMCRTVVNVTGDLAIATIIARRESGPPPA